MNSIKHIFRKVSAIQDLTKISFGKNPEVDWKIIFLSSAVLSLLMVFAGAYMFVKVDKGDIFVVENSAGEGERSLNLSALEETVSYYEEKEAEFENIKNSGITSVDPSL